VTSRRYPPQQTSRPLRFAPSVRGPEWQTHGYRQPGWLLMPLRMFLGVTFTFAGLQKLADPNFFNAKSPASVQHQMSLLAGTSPIGPLVRLSLHAGFLTGLLIALAELAVGVGTLLGLRARLAAAGGALLALTFFLTVSWNTTPYYYGADIVFVFAWTPFIMIGAAGVLSLDGWLADRARSDVMSRRRGGVADQQELAGQRERRVIVTAGALTLLIGSLTALAGRLAGGTPAASGSPALTPKTTRGRSSTSRSGAGHSPSSKGTPSGTHIGAATAVPVGEAAQFNDPATGNPAWMVCLKRGSFAAFSAVCTHAGCIVQYQAGSKEFVCPCHGGVYSARTGQVLGGPPPTPLPSIPVQVSNGQLYVD
jgi:thiosulfate dehydrogenase (quinone) large subunit